ncbi:protease [Streptomyces albus subsp. albus]|nr:protease [Streptomyces albus subsp. albus]
MSTENEGPAVPPAPESRPAPPGTAAEPAGASAGTSAEDARSATPPTEPAAPAQPPTEAPATPVPGAAAPAGPGTATESAAAPPPAQPVPPAPAADAPTVTQPTTPAPPAAPSTAAPSAATATAGDPTPGPAPAVTPSTAPSAGAPPAGRGGTWWAGESVPDPAAGAGGTGGGWGAPVPVPGAVPPARKRRSGGIVAAVLAAVLAAGGIGGGIGYWAADRDQESTGSTTVSAPGNAKSDSRAPGSVSAIAGKALPSVVTIEAQSSSGEGGTGTGFVYDKQGHILTNNHVVASAAESGKLTATFSDGKRYDAEVVGRAEGYDVAVIKLKNPSDVHLNPLPLGDSDRVRVGDATVAIGAPFGLSGTVTTGIVSAKNRPVASSDGGGTSASYMSALQTDASINPGNSGGPLLNGNGAVIGINSAIQSAGSGGGFGGEAQQSGSIGLGFAIPINQARNVADQLIKTGRPVYPVIEATVTMKDSGNGATIARSGADGSAAVIPGGPADKAGLKPGDVITKLDGTIIDSGPTLISEIWTHQPGDKVKLTYQRDGRESTVQLTLGQREGDS